MKKIFSLFVSVMMSCASFAQTILVIGLDGSVIDTYGVDQINQLVFDGADSMNKNISTGDALVTDAYIEVLVVQVANGESLRIALKHQPRVTILDNGLLLTTDYETITLDGTKLINFTFESASSLVDLMNSAEPSFFFDNSILRVSGLDGFEPISLYTVNGQCIYSDIADYRGHAELNISSYQGVFVVKTKTHTLKFAK